MAKLWGPLFSLSAHGKLGALIYECGRYGQYVKGLTPQRYKPSEAQLVLNVTFGITAENWHALTDQQKETYNVNARGTKMTGFNLYIKQHFHENLP